jgi:protein-S-isoprenylcysteine O-methyltransferase Ste14
MRKVWAVIGSAIFLVVAPGFVAGLVPWWISHWEFGGALPLRLLGGGITSMGILGLLDCFRRFALQGIGTPAPVFPTRHLVVTGFYLRVRNPMYISVIAIILGQGVLFGNVAVLEYGAIVWLLFHLFVLIYEEPTLRSTFGAEYQSYCAEVPRWIPRFKRSITHQPTRREG